MAKPDLPQLRQRLRDLHARMAGLLDTFMGRQPLLKAYLRDAPVTCGNPNCRCYRGEPHPAWVVRVPEGRRARTHSVSQAAFERLRAPADAYRRWRQARAEWNRLARQVQQVLAQMERLRTVDLNAWLEE
jgi:hypothetical protein